MGSSPSVGEEQWVIMGRRQDCIHGRENICPKQQENHDSVDVEHSEQQQMLKLIKRNYWWPGLKEDVKKYVQDCFKCQQNKVQHQRKSGELYLLCCGNH